MICELNREEHSDSTLDMTSSDILQRKHEFVTKRSFLRDACDICGKLFRFGINVLKCSDCRITCHLLCRNQAPLPCAPRNFTPSLKSEGRVLPRLADYCPDFSPMIPHIVIHLVAQMDKDYLRTKNIYNSSGLDSQVDALLKRFKSSRHIPVINDIGGRVLGECLKKFLSELRDPLIPHTSYAEFLNSIDNEDQLTQLIGELPVPNRETLAFLCEHWVRITENHAANEMTLDKLAEAVGPIVFGVTRVKTANAPTSTEDQRCTQAMKVLLELPQSAWTDLPTNNFNIRGTCTPRRTPLRTPLGSRLSLSRRFSVSRTPATSPKWK
ncbi:hypothetical protein L596_002773 [Steinernema carpocapsae]|uniref:Rho-GAP domain-containing protein n=1 Tax=Steinernema carpocapsae TaxID=34508 RepID=A0A4U8UQ76_STECR|nr:hypothetical protein L596_002773 [Steinernema carpocapsae]